MIASFENVSKIYGTGDGLHATSFTLNSGEVVGLFGVNGSGKTTTMKLLSGLLQADQGSIQIKGRSPRQSRDEISYLGDKASFYSWMTPQHIQDYMSGLFKNFDPESFKTLAARLEIPNKAIGGMSKGQGQRLRLVATMSRKASLYILDEPLSGIDLLSRQMIIENLFGSWDKSSTILLSTHEIKEAESFFHRGIYLQEGRLISDITSEALRKDGKGLTDHFIELHQGKGH